MLVSHTHRHTSTDTRAKARSPRERYTTTTTRSLVVVLATRTSSSSTSCCWPERPNDHLLCVELCRVARSAARLKGEENPIGILIRIHIAIAGKAHTLLARLVDSLSLSLSPTFASCPKVHTLALTQCRLLPTPRGTIIEGGGPANRRRQPPDNIESSNNYNTNTNTPTSSTLSSPESIQICSLFATF